MFWRFSFPALIALCHTDRLSSGEILVCLEILYLERALLYLSRVDRRKLLQFLEIQLTNSGDYLTSVLCGPSRERLS